MLGKQGQGGGLEGRQATGVRRPLTISLGRYICVCVCVCVGEGSLLVYFAQE